MHFFTGGNTIDTFSTGNVESTTIDGGKTFTITRPPFVVNQAMCIDKGLLFLNSALRGDNENKNTLENYWPIDIYNLKKRQYIGSFYLNAAKHETIKSMQIHGDNLYVLAGNQLCSYQMDSLDKIMK